MASIPPTSSATAGAPSSFSAVSAPPASAEVQVLRDQLQQAQNTIAALTEQLKTVTQERDQLQVERDGLIKMLEKCHSAMKSFNDVAAALA